MVNGRGHPGGGATLDVDALPLPTPTAWFRRHAWAAFQRAIDPLAQPKPLPSEEPYAAAAAASRASDSSLPSTSSDSNNPGDTRDPVNATRIG